MGSGKGSPKSNSDSATVAASRHVLPSDLPTAIKHLEDQELDLLFDAVVAERLQRGMKSPLVCTDNLNAGVAVMKSAQDGV